MKFREKFYGIDPTVAKLGIGPSEYKDLYPLFVFDVSKQSERLKSSVTDITIRAQFSENVPAETQAYATVISDRLLKFVSNGNKMTVIM